MIQLRDYQEKSVSDIRQCYIDGCSAPILVLPTGAGKTVVFSHIAKQTALRNKVVWILVHRVELLRQTSKALTKSSVEHGLVNPKYTPNPSATVQVASVQTMVNRTNKFQPPDLVIVDECHHATAGSWRKILDNFPLAKVLGVTATPCRTDGKGLDLIFDSMIVGPQIGDLIELGHLVKPIVYAPKNRIDFSTVSITKGDYDRDEVVQIMNKPKITGDAIAHYKRICSGEPCVVFCSSIAHAEEVASEFRAAGYKFYSVDGSMDDETRSRLMNGLGVDIEGIVSCDLISEGTDIPAIVCGIMLRPTQSLSLYIQQAGRILRLMEGKKHAYLLDHVGNVFQHGAIDQEREWSLEGRKKGNKKSSQENNIRVIQCKECYAVYEPAPSCPACGHTPEVKAKEIEVVDGELEILTEEQKEVIKISQRQQVSKARTLDDLKKVAKQNGHSHKWAEHVNNARIRKSEFEKNRNLILSRIDSESIEEFRKLYMKIGDFEKCFENFIELI